MSTTTLSKSELIRLIGFQQDEITGSAIYARIAHFEKDDHNKKVLQSIARDEVKHEKIFFQFTGVTVKPQKLKISIYTLLARVLGVTFTVKLLERNEGIAIASYTSIAEIPNIKQIIEDEERHEQELIAMLEEERLQYLGSIVLGLNDALVELTGALAGFTLALQSAQLVALTGAITGIAAALSMASSEFLSTRVEEPDKPALKAALYTGTAYFITVVILILPFLLLGNVFISLGISLASAIGIIAFFNFYYSVVRDDSFKKRFAEMAIISLGVAGISFGIGFLLKHFMGVDA